MLFLLGICLSNYWYFAYLPFLGTGVLFSGCSLFQFGNLGWSGILLWCLLGNESLPLVGCQQLLQKVLELCCSSFFRLHLLLLYVCHITDLVFLGIVWVCPGLIGLQVCFYITQLCSVVWCCLHFWFCLLLLLLFDSWNVVLFNPCGESETHLWVWISSAMLLLGIHKVFGLALTHIFFLSFLLCSSFCML